METLRSKLLEITKEIDRQIEQEQKKSEELLKEIIESKDISESVTSHLGEISDSFIQLLNVSAKKASDANDQALLDKYNMVIAELQKYSTPPPEYALLQELIDADDEKSIDKLLADHADKINDEFLQLVSGIVARTESETESSQLSQDEETLKKIKLIYRKILLQSMKKNMG